MLMIANSPLMLGAVAATGPAAKTGQDGQGRPFAKTLWNLGVRSFLAGASFSCLSLLCSAVSLPAMSEEAKLLNVSYDPTRELYSDIKDRKSTRLNSSHIQKSRMPSSA